MKTNQKIIVELLVKKIHSTKHPILSCECIYNYKIYIISSWKFYLAIQRRKEFLLGSFALCGK